MPTYETVKRVFFRTIGAILVASALLYAVDYVFLLLKIPPNRPQLGSVTVQPYYEIHEKSGKTEYDYIDPQPQTCVNSLFPHMGYQPCWYLRRHPERKIEV
jgi:hypothetical protein